MPTLSINRLTQILHDLGVDEDRFVQLSGEPERLAALLTGYRTLSDLQRKIDGIEDEIGRTVGWPRLVIELADGNLEFVSRPADIEAIVDDGKLSQAEGALLKASLAEQLARWRRACSVNGLGSLRGREHRLANRLLSETDHLLRQASVERPSAAWLRIILVIATLEPGASADILLRIANDLMYHLAV